MKNLIIYSIFYLIIASSCESILDVEPVDLIVEDNVFNSKEDIESGIIAAYGFASSENIIEISSLASDDVFRPSTNRGQGVQLNSWSYIASNTEAAEFWFNSYRTIAQANKVLYATDLLLKEGKLTQQEADYYNAEMYALRALMHFDLYRAMGQKYSETGLAVPYIDLEDNNGNNYPDGLETSLQPERIEIPLFFEKVLNDIDNALNASIPTQLNQQNITRFNYFAIKSLEARVSLYGKRYDRAINAANEVINNFNICSFNNYQSVWTDESNDGVLFKLERSNDDFQVGTIWTGNNLDIFFSPSYEITSLINPNSDIRYYTNFFTLENGNTIIGKYLGSNGVIFLNDIKIFRVSELYLIRAEANLKVINTNIDQANADLRALRSQRIVQYNHSYVSDPDLLMEEIIEERRKELAYEGHRFFDLKRNDLPINRSELDCGGAVPCNLESDDFRFNFPIPQEEVFANKNIQQNPGYGQN
ncbi:RagB/SusD family nutrient uptake outer membrane protein [Mangrovivirga cuniculi]|uniref:RagB/SusD family nutrient uptake outer membrane protein n=1 Tax=Mangrovivirga cuniculi TaxID=2715131 RepID=A0A4D7JID9_9BACT|nr:RagB/SusD family nutrient uptake outer membrane protein [Mangrovivirga cuniculi]QCK15381.1 hypothetical protein DCC35_11810 [Mangrovivirga cuniculi]